MIWRQRQPFAIAMILLGTAGVMSTGPLSGQATRGGSPVAAEILAQEKRIWEAEKTQDFSLARDMIADDFVDIGPTGRSTKTETLEGMQKVPITSYTFADVKVLTPASDVGIVTMRFTQQHKGRAAVETGYAASTWVRRSGKWVNVLYVSFPAVRRPPAKP